MTASICPSGILLPYPFPSSFPTKSSAPSPFHLPRVQVETECLVNATMKTARHSALTPPFMETTYITTS